MKFQDSSFNDLKVIVGTKSVTHARTHAPTKSIYSMYNIYSTCLKYNIIARPAVVRYNRCVTSSVYLWPVSESAHNS